MPVIYSRNFATGNQQYLSIGAADYLRTPTIGTGWNRLRIGILYALNTVSEQAWPIRNCSLNLGVCNGIQNSVGMLAPTHGFGYGTPFTPAAAALSSMTYNAGTSGNSYFSTSSYQFFRTAAGTTTTSATGSFTINASSATLTGGALARRGLLIFDLNKSALVSGNMTMGITGNAVAHCALDITSADMYSALEWYGSAATVQGTQLSTLALGNSLAFNEITNGALDTIFLFWSHYTVPLQLYELAVYRVG